MRCWLSTQFYGYLGPIVLILPLEHVVFGLLQRHLKTEQVGLIMALLSELLIITLAAQMITGLLIVYHFGRLSLVSIQGFPVLRTDERGTIEFSTDGERLWVETAR